MLSTSEMLVSVLSRCHNRPGTAAVRSRIEECPLADELGCQNGFHKMVHSLPLADNHGDNERSAGREPLTRPHLVAIADDEVELVHAAGGLVYDRRSVGWDVDVFLLACANERVLRILGVRPRILGSIPLPEVLTCRPDVVVASHDVYANTEHVHTYIRETSHQQTELVFWGGVAWPGDPEQGVGLVQYQLSSAAQAFKQHAIGATGASASTELCAAEIFYSGNRRVLVAGASQPRW